MSRFTKTKKRISGQTADGAKPTNPKLYAQVKAEVKKEFDRFPSAYASAAIVKKYKARGGKYEK